MKQIDIRDYIHTPYGTINDGDLSKVILCSLLNQLKVAHIHSNGNILKDPVTLRDMLVENRKANSYRWWNPATW